MGYPLHFSCLVCEDNCKIEFLKARFIEGEYVYIEIICKNIFSL